MKQSLNFVLVASCLTATGFACGASQNESPEENAKTEKPANPAVEKESETEPPVQPAGPPIERRLFPHSYTASSHLQNDWNKFQENYLAAYLGDDDPKTSWTEGKDDVGLGETVTVQHTPLKDATELRLEIRNGYQKTPRLFTRNARAKDITLKLLPSGAESKHTLKDAEGWQSIKATQPKGRLEGYTIQFNSVYKGSHYEDLVVSDIQTFVTAETPDNPTFEKTKQKALQTWVTQRREAADLYKNATKGSIPVAAQYKRTKSKNAIPAPEEECYTEEACELPFGRAKKLWKGDSALFAEWENAAKERFASWKQLRISVDDKRDIPFNDNFERYEIWNVLWEMGDQAKIALPAVNSLGIFSTKSIKRVNIENDVTAPKVLDHKAPGCNRANGSKNFYFSPDGDGPLRTLLIAICGSYEDREGLTDATHWQLLHYGDDGQLKYLSNFYSSNLYQWEIKDGVPFLQEAQRTSTAGPDDATFTAK